MRASMTRCIRLLACPVCGAPLAREGPSLRCLEGHTYDVAREGYVDLAPAGHGRSRRAGDTREMLQARRRFLQHRHYDVLAATLAGLARDAANASDGTFTVLDAGCGEGHYLARVAGELEAVTSCCLFGLDLSRDALRMAARALPEAHFFLNDVAHGITMADASVDLLLDAFAPRNPEEFARVVAPRGALLVVIPGDEHLGELRERLPLLDIHPDKRERVTSRLEGAFRLEAHQEIVNRSTFSGDDVRDLVAMGPSARHVDEAVLARAVAMDPVDVTTAFQVLMFRRGRAEA